MQPGDYVLLALSLGIGLWWLALPGSVNAFYRRLYRGRLKMPRPIFVRLAGAVWTLLALIMFSHFISR